MNNIRSVRPLDREILASAIEKNGVIRLMALTEFSLLPCLLMMLVFSRHYVFLPVHPLFPQFHRVADKVVGWAERTNRGFSFQSICPEFHPERQHSFTMFHDIFGKIEEWQDKTFKFDSSEERLGQYDRPYKHLVANYFDLQLYNILAIARLASLFPQNKIVISGVEPVVSAATKTFISKTSGVGHPDLSRLHFNRSMSLSWLANLLFGIVAMSVTFGWIIKKTRLMSPPGKYYFFAADYVLDEADINLYLEVEEGGPVLLVGRRRENITNHIPERIAHYDTAFQDDGIIPLRNSLPSLACAVRGFWCLWPLFPSTPIPIFYQLMQTPFRRLRYRALFHKFRPAVFWGRDLYLVDHIIRQQELHRIGGESWGVLHAHLTYAYIYPMFRYLSFDRFYSMSKEFFEKHYLSKWSSGMVIRGTESFRPDRAQFLQRRPVSQRPVDILVSVSVFVYLTEMDKFVRDLAQQFTDRKIFVQVKETFARTNSGKSFLDSMLGCAGNVVLRDETPYELFDEVGYVFSDPSTVITEAIQFGIRAHMVDVYEQHCRSMIREVDDLCVGSGLEAADRIRALESGSTEYPINKISTIVNLHGEFFADTVRKDLGLKPNDIKRPVWNIS